MTLYLGFFATNFTLFRLNARRGHKFIISFFLAWYCMTRVLACTLRIVWATRPHDVSVGIAANIFAGLGVLLVYIFNLLFAQRILRALHPAIGWHPMVRALYKAKYALLICTVVLLVSMTVLEFYTLDRHTLSVCAWVLRGAIVFIFVLAASPLVVLAICFTVPVSQEVHHFGEGSMVSRVCALLLTTIFCTIIAGFKVGTGWSTPRPATDPAWYDSKACFYIFNFTFEILTLSVFLLSRVDKRFHVPDGSSKRKTYLVQKDEVDIERQQSEDSVDPEKLAAPSV